MSPHPPMLQTSETFSATCVVYVWFFAYV